MSEEIYAARAGGWDAALLATVAEINEQLLAHLQGLAQQLAGAGGSAPPLLGELAAEWRELKGAAQRRLAGGPCLLLDAGFAQPQRWEFLPGAAVMDSGARGSYFRCARGVALVRRTLLFGWHLARANRVSARLLLGMSAPAAERIGACRLSELEALAEQAPAWIVPRWEQQGHIWRQLLAAASRGQGAQLRQAQLRGLQLLARAAASRGGG